MKEFIYIENYSLHHVAAAWLTNMGFRETRWILDGVWISFSYDITYKQWIR